MSVQPLTEKELERIGRQRRDFVTEKELAAELRISLRHLITLRNQRVIPHIKMGSRIIRYSRAAVARALEKMTVKEIA
jgi:hypothetical protein